MIRYLNWLTTNFVITSNRLIFRHGVIGKSGIEIPLERVNNVNFNQSVFERMLGAGDLLIESGGEDGQQRFTDIRHPAQVQNLIHAQMEGHFQRRASYVAAPTGDVTEQLSGWRGCCSAAPSPRRSSTPKRPSSCSDTPQAGQAGAGSSTSAISTLPVRRGAASTASENCDVSMNNVRRSGPPSMQAKQR